MVLGRGYCSSSQAEAHRYRGLRVQCPRACSGSQPFLRSMMSRTELGDVPCCLDASSIAFRRRPRPGLRCRIDRRKLP
jgi:hypothetical protein